MDDLPTDLPALAAALHAARGTVPLIEPPVRTGVFHWRRGQVTGERLPTIPVAAPAERSRWWRQRA